MQPMIPASLTLALLLVAGAAGAQSVPSFQDGSRDDQSSGELFFVIQELRQQVRHLQGRVEEQNHKIEQLNRQGRERYVDLDERLLELSKRMTALEDGVARAPSSSATGEAAGSGQNGSQARRETRSYRQPDDAERKAYGAIQKLIQEQRDYDGAIDAIYAFVDKYPEGDLRVNALYWLGEVYLAQENPDQARDAFSLVVTRYDDHRKAPDALYKLAVAQQQLGEKKKAREALQQVIARYPDSKARSLASTRLESL